jgi:hypothetical protein
MKRSGTNKYYCSVWDWSAAFGGSDWSRYVPFAFSSALNHATPQSSRAVGIPVSPFTTLYSRKKLETDRKPTLVMQKSLNISHRSISKFQTFGPFASVNHAIPSPIFRLAWPGRRAPGRGRPRPPGPRRIGAPGIQIDCYMGVSKNSGIPKSSTCFWGFSMK